ncbi:MAG: D-Ala-D-Ala carboxypeptidase family metallohydrolase [Rhodocyclaceae bacterium]
MKAFLLSCFLLVPHLVLAADVRDEVMFEQWRKHQESSVQAFEAFLVKEKLVGLVPLHHLLRNASDWKKCQSPPFEVPPQGNWQSVSSTLQLISELKSRGLLGSFEVHSAYRNPQLNDCADGAPESAHKTHYALDITATAQTKLADALCQFWRTEGKRWRMGLSRYKSGRIHIDTKRFRTWGNKGKPSYCAA